MKPLTVCAGHGGIELDGWGWKRDPGRIAFGHAEADLAAEMRDMVVDTLRSRGHEVRTDGGRGINRALAYAMTLIAGSRAAVEIHFNGFFSPEATGVEVVAAPAQKAAAQDMAHSVATVLGLRLRGVRGWVDEADIAKARGYRLGFVARGGMILETCFISNPNDLKAYLPRRQEVAAAIAGALERA